MRKGFTLLELLVVVIIVAILATIAIPQYFKVAERARASEAVNALGGIRSSQLRYYTEKATFASTCADLDMDSSSLKFFGTYTCAVDGTVTLTRSSSNNSGFGAYILSMDSAGTISCNSNGGQCPSGF